MCESVYLCLFLIGALTSYQKLRGLKENKFLYSILLGMNLTWQNQGMSRAASFLEFPGSNHFLSGFFVVAVALLLLF
jgi:hypothetical protein